jgi:general secretion pathway protein I
MARSLVKLLRQNEAGLTLIEVLIALLILSIALTAVIKSTAQNIKNTLYLQNRTIATWIGTDIINNARLGILKVPAAPDHLAETSLVLGQSWSWEVKLNDTPNSHIKEIDVAVYQVPGNNQLAHIVSYISY